MDNSTLIDTKRQSAARIRRMAAMLSRADDRATLLQFAQELEEESRALECDAHRRS